MSEVLAKKAQIKPSCSLFFIFLFLTLGGLASLLASSLCWPIKIIVGMALVGGYFSLILKYALLKTKRSLAEILIDLQQKTWTLLFKNKTTIVTKVNPESLFWNRVLFLTLDYKKNGKRKKMFFTIPQDMMNKEDFHWVKYYLKFFYYGKSSRT
jgi:hypothetical protein